MSYRSICPNRFPGGQNSSGSESRSARQLGSKRGAAPAIKLFIMVDFSSIDLSKANYKQLRSIDHENHGSWLVEKYGN
jgi:hypothetical protein